MTQLELFPDDVVNYSEQGLPDSWKRATLNELYRIVGGGTPSTEQDSFWSGEIPWITSADVYGLEDIRPKRFITHEAIEASTTNLVTSQSIIVVTRVGLGKLAITEHPLCFSQDSQALVDETGLLYPRYILYYLSQAVQKFKYQSRGTTIAGVTKKQLAEVKVPLAPLGEQQRIVEAIESLFTQLDAGVGALKRLRANLRRYKAAVLKAACEGKLVPQDPDDEPASDLLERILTERRMKGKESRKIKYEESAGVDTSDLPELPAGWVWASSEQFCLAVVSGSTPKADKMYDATGDIPFLKVYNLTNTGSLNYEYKPTFIDLDTHTGLLARARTYPGDVLMNIVGPPLGKISLVPATFPEWNINQAIVCFRPAPQISNKYLCYLLLAPNTIERFEATSKATAGQFNLSVTTCRTLPLPLPPSNEQLRIAEQIEIIFSIVNNVEHRINDSLKRAERLRQAILKQAFEGKLVPQNPNDEPANLLLEHIKQGRESQPRKKIK